MDSLLNNLISQFGAIAVAVVAGIFGLRANSRANANDKRTKKISEVLAGSSGATTLDQVIGTMQEEYKDSQKRHKEEIEAIEARHRRDMKYINIQVEDVQRNLAHCQTERSNLTIEVERLNGCVDDLTRRLDEDEKLLNKKP